SPVADLIRANLESLKIKSGFEIVRQDVLRALPSLLSRGVQASYVFLDPPYRMQDLYRHTLLELAQSQMLNTEGLVIAEHEKRYDPGEQFGALCRHRRLDQGDASLSFYKRQAANWESVQPSK